MSHFMDNEAMESDDEEISDEEAKAKLHKKKGKRSSNFQFGWFLFCNSSKFKVAIQHMKFGKESLTLQFLT